MASAGGPAAYKVIGSSLAAACACIGADEAASAGS